MATRNDRAILNAIINPLLPVDEFEDITTENKDFSLPISDCQEIQDAKDFEREGVCFAESGQLENAVQMFDKAIETSPFWPSAYNNKAQALRLLMRNEEAMENLNKAIELSCGKGKAASQAYCQRAMLHHIGGKKEQALKDWQSAADLGHSFAKSQLIKMNPYAALCNKMLQDVFRNLNPY